ncbi:ankyrin repeat domain-containing protein [Ekhidna sp.]
MSSDFNKDFMIRSGDFKGFIHSVMNEDIDGVAYYISIGMDVNFLHPEIMTNPLIEATKVGNIEIVQLLLDNGANPKIVSQLGESPIKIAKSLRNKELISLLKRR